MRKNSRDRRPCAPRCSASSMRIIPGTILSVEHSQGPVCGTSVALVSLRRARRRGESSPRGRVESGSGTVSERRHDSSKDRADRKAGGQHLAPMSGFKPSQRAAFVPRFLAEVARMADTELGQTRQPFAVLRGAAWHQAKALHQLAAPVGEPVGRLEFKDDAVAEEQCSERFCIAVLSLIVSIMIECSGCGVFQRSRVDWFILFADSRR